MDKKKVFNSYFDTFCGSGFHTTESDDEFYSKAIERSEYWLQRFDFNPEDIKEIIEQVIFWAFYDYGEYTFQKELPIMDVEGIQLPANLPPEKFKEFKDAIQVVVDTFKEITSTNGLKTLLTMEDFNDILTRKEKFTMEIPPIWLNT